jgi:predicted Zn-dependent protease with MMP-like domain
MPIADKVFGMEPVDVDTFEGLVTDALATIPDQLRAEMENVAIIIDYESPPGSLYGLYEGIPLTKRRGLGGGTTRSDHPLPRHHLPVGQHARGAGPTGAGHVAARGGPPLRYR